MEQKTGRDQDWNGIYSISNSALSDDGPVYNQGIKNLY